MKKVEAIIRPHLLDAVKNALQEVNVVGLRVSGEEELQGLDLSQHGEDGYNLDLDLVPALAGSESHAGHAPVGAASVMAEQA